MNVSSLKIVCTAVLASTVVAGLTPVGVRANANKVGGEPQTLAVVTIAFDKHSYGLGNGKFAWIDAANRCTSQVRVLDLATRRRTAFGACDGLEGPAGVAIGDGAVVWYTFSGGNTESVENVYSNLGGRTHRLASYHDTGCDDGSPCGVGLFETGGHAYVAHGDSISKVSGSALEPTPVNLANAYVGGAAWPLVALIDRTSVVDTPTNIHVHRLADGRQVGSVQTLADSTVFSSSILAANALTPTADIPRRIDRIYDLRTGKQIAVIRDERPVAVLGRRVFSLAPAPGARFRVHAGVPLRRLVVRGDGGTPHFVAAIGGEVPWSEQHGSRLYWAEQRYRGSGTVTSLRTINLAG
jgi:hypothetical protein